MDTDALKGKQTGSELFHEQRDEPVELRDLVPAPRGGYMFRSTWHTHWHSIRASAGMPDQDFYELKHRAIQWMIDPVEDGGLGLDNATAAEIIGHNDGGYLIATVYTKLGQRRAIARAQHAMNTYQQHITTAPEQDHQTGPSCNSSAKESPSRP